MHIHHLVVDNFLERPLLVRQWALGREFKDEVSPADGVTYKGICYPLPELFRGEVHLKLSFLMGVTVVPHLDFLRLSVDGYNPPHRIHTDCIQAQYTAIIYLNLPGQCQGGTGMYEHMEGMERNPQNTEEHAIWFRDTNDFTKWRTVGGTDMKWNRALVMASDLFHASLPKEGFGGNVEDGRLVWVSFFNASEG